MKFVFDRVTAAIFLLVLSLSTGCSDSSSFTADPQGTVKVVAPAPTSDGAYKLQVFELLGIEDLKELSGQFAKFFFSPKIRNSHLEGEAPRSQFLVNSNGEYIPKDEMTQQLAVIYLHMQRLAALDKELGLEGLNKWPRDVGMAVNVSGGITNNAFYDGQSDSMLIVPYKAQDMAIALNGGILAHEHFHSIFYKLALKNNSKTEAHNRRDFLKAAGIQDESENKNENAEELKNLAGRPEVSSENSKPLAVTQKRLIYQETFLRALNEGLADYWGWMYTGDPDFIALSLKSAGRARNLDRTYKDVIVTLPRAADIVDKIEMTYADGENEKFESNALAFSYKLGTSFARFFKYFAEVYGESRQLENVRARKDIARKIVEMLPEFMAGFKEASDKDRYYDSLDLVKLLLEKTPDLKSEECEAVVPTLNFLKIGFDKQYSCVVVDGKVQVELTEVSFAPPAETLLPPPRENKTL